MALTMKIQSSMGLEIPEAYIKIDSLSGNKNMLQINVKTYVSQTAAQEDRVPVEDTYKSFTPSVEEDAKNFIKQGYEFLKSLPEYDGAIDILE
ncbi:hypothetical protein [Paenibacillus sp. FSL M7-0896]|uniref:hypothetical protein n=1 Tax=unclassified Paenibacillus TaxID=185978 RepID=UPI0030D6F479